MPRNIVKMILVIAACALFAFVSSAAVAAEQKETASSGKAASSTKKSSSSSKKKAECSQTTALDEKEVQESFASFQQEWMRKLAVNGQYGQSYTTVEEDPNEKGAYFARYIDLSEPLQSEVKNTGKKGCPFVGTLNYERITYVSKGTSPDEARKGPFQPESREVITEIFRYGNNEWIY